MGHIEWCEFGLLKTKKRDRTLKNLQTVLIIIQDKVVRRITKRLSSKEFQEDMKENNFYLMENAEEIFRLELKTDPEKVRQQARWCGIGPGHKILDVGCGIGKTSSVLFELSKPKGKVLGVDFSKERIAYAREHYANKEGLSFREYDLKGPLEALGDYDLIWVRFFLEYFRKESFEIVKKLTKILKPGGTLCLIDLDYNCLNHYETSQPVEDTLKKLMVILENKHNFDPYMGRKLYSYLYDLGYKNIKVELQANHLIYGDIEDKDFYNWMKKLETISEKVPEAYEDYPGGAKAFYKYMNKFLKNPRRFTYNPLILCKGIRT